MMKIKTMMKKTLSVTLSAAMIMGMGVTALAGDTVDTPSTPSASSGTETTAPIYSFDVVNVVVPSTFEVAFNPDELDVKVGSDTKTDQVVSQSYGILNKSTKDKIVEVTLTIEDMNTDKITFFDTKAAAQGADKDTYGVYLSAVPADDTEVKIGTASADKDTAAVALSDVKMTASTTVEIPLLAGENYMEFFLEKAKYTQISGSELTLGTSNDNDVKDNFELSGVAAAGKGITAFTFSGALNKTADWTALENGIKISAVYEFTNAEGQTAMTGTGAMVENKAPRFTTGDDIGVIEYTLGKDGEAFSELNGITAMWEGAPLDLKPYTSVDATNSKIIISYKILSGWAAAGENPKATITYTNVDGNEATAKVVVKTH